MDIQEKEALISEIEQFKEEALKMHIVQVLAHTYTITSLFDYSIDSDGSVIWYKAQARQLWDFWQAVKAQDDQKIKILLCDDHLKKCESPTGIFNSQYPDEEPCLICLAKEAKAQAVPEGFVLINAESLAFHAKSIRMFNDGDSEHQREEIEDHVCSIEAMIEAQEPAND